MSDGTYSGVAIVGMAGRFPGAESIEEFWANLLAGKESISFFTDAELVESGFDPAELRRRGCYVPARGLLKDADCFDAAFFGVHPKEAEVIDPQHRVFLEACWVALERAGYAPNRMPGAVGIFAGATFNTYVQQVLQLRPDLTELIGAELVMFGNEKDYMTTRVAYKLGLKGPALSISTACSTSLVAVCQACRSLLTYESDVALAGGVSVTVPQKRGYYFEEGYIGSPDGHTRTFDEKGAGTVFSNGVAVVVLKRLEDAVRDRDQVYAVIKGAALNNDGSQRVSFGAPGIEGQSEAIAMAHALAEVDPATITYVEAHGTATPLGDPIEVTALTNAFRLATDAKQFCGIGSVKSNIGHLDAAAGVAGLIKVALALRHKVIPASLHFEKPNPKIDLANSPFFVNAELRDWKVPSGIPRRAGVSSFGSGGTNAHVVVEEAPELPASGPSRPWQLLPISAKTPEALDRATADLSVYLKQLAHGVGNERKVQELADAAFTLQTGRGEFIHRRIVVCQDSADGAAALEAGDPKRVFTHRQDLRDAAVVFMFPGQGAQYPGMGADLYRTEPLFRAEVDRCAEVLTPILHDDIRRIMFPLSGSEKESEALLIQTKFTQPALFVIEYALAKLWMSWGIQPTSMIGHSVGEYVAGCLAGVFSLDDALMLVARRGALVQAQPGGAMLAIRLSEKDVFPLLPNDTSIAAINSPTLCVASGPYESITALEQQLEAKGVKARRLHTSHAFHSAMMEPVLEPFNSLLQSVTLGAPTIPYVSNVSAQWITAAEAQAPEYWAGHVRQTVRFSDGVAQLTKDPKQVLLEVGPGQTLCTLARQHPEKQAEQPVLASLPLAGDQELRGLNETLGRLWMVGVTIDWQGYYGNEHRRRAVLPTYPFERKRYWPDLPQGAVKGTMPPATIVAPACGEHVPASPPAAVVQPIGVSLPVTSASSEQAIPRKERLLAEVRGLMQELSGYDLSAVDACSDLLELGFDSLLLTQAAQLIQRKFLVQVSFRQLMEDLSSLDAIASHLDTVMPPDATSHVRPVSVAQTAPETTASGAVPQVVLEQILLQQQQLSNQILQLMGRQPVAVPSPSVVVSPSPVPGEPGLPAPPSGKSHGPFKPFDRHASTALSDGQKRALEALIARYTKKTSGSKKLAGEHRTVLADPRSVAGFNRLWKEMVYPIVSVRSDGSKVWDIDGNEYVDFVMGFGADFFGHRPPFLVQAVHEQLDRGFEIGPIQPIAYEVATLIKEFTGMERVGFTNTGSEAILAAMRVARTVSGRDKIAVFAGAYHGIFDEVLFRPLTINGETRTAAIAPGIPDSALAQVIVLDYGNPQSLDILKARGSEIAAVFVEPVQARRLDLQPVEFLRELRRITQDLGIALVFDEVVTGFRVHPGGAQALFGIRADLATYGKVLGGGIPIGAVTGCAKYMDALDGGHWQYSDASFPEVGVTFFAGTCVRHPLALAAAKSVLLYLKQQGPDLQKRLADRTARLAEELRAVIDEFRAPYQLVQFSALMTLTFKSDQKLAGLLFYLLRYRGVLIWENRNFIITTAHSEADLARLVEVFRESLFEMREAGFLPALGDESRTQDVGSNLPAVSQPQDGGKAFPLTEAQKEIWLAAQMGDDATVAYNESLRFDFRGRFDSGVFTTAARQVARRHPILLARVSEDGQWQEVDPAGTIEVPVVDLGGLDEVERQKELSVIVDREASAPFDLVSGPLLRIRVIRLSAEHHVVIWSAHHIVCDGWSGGVLVGELAKIYSAITQGHQPTLDEPLSFQEYALTVQQESPSRRKAVEYWRRQLAEIPAPLDLPLDRGRPLVRSSSAATFRKSFDRTLYQALKRTAGQLRTTMVVLLMTAMKMLVYRLTGQTDLVIGLPVSGQAVTGKSCLVGHCVSLLPIRTNLRPEAGFHQNVAIVKKNVLDAYDHHQSTIGTILQLVNVPRLAGRQPLVEIIFNVDKDSSTEEFSDVQFVCERNPKRALHYDLFFNFVEGPRGLYLECDYNTDLFNSETVEQWLGYYQTLLEHVVVRPSEQVDMLPIMTDSEHDELVHGWNDPSVGFPKHLKLHELFEAQVEKNPEAHAVTAEGRYLTYGELNRRANQLAHRLKSMGAGPDVLVGLFLERSLDMLVGILGILKTGAAYVPMDPEYPKERLGYILEDSHAFLVVTKKALANQLPGFSGQLICLDVDWADIAQGCEDDLVSGVTPQNLAYVLFTSGSTGRPKGVAIEHHSAVTFVQWASRVFGPEELSGVLFSTSVCFDLSVFELFVTLNAGGTIIVAPNALHLPNLSEKNDVTLINTVPSAITELLHMGGVPASVKVINLAGEALSDAVVEQIYARTNVQKVYNLYGPTEATTYSTYTLIPRGVPVTIGRPISNTQAYILDTHRKLVPRGVRGELYLAGEGLARGYYGRPDLTEERFVANPFESQPGARMYRTGDLCRWLPDRSIQYLGRLDHQIKLRGFRIELGEIEATLDRFDGVRQSLVMAREDQPGHKLLVAYVVTEPGVQLDVDALRRHIRQCLPEFMMPSAILMLEAFPLSPNGKINRAALPVPSFETGGTAKEFVGPRTDTETMLASIWSEVLKLERVGVQDNFFELGGHSLLVIRVVSRIRNLFGVTVTPRTFFANPTIAMLAHTIDGAQQSSDGVPRIERSREEGPSPLSFAQERMWFLYQLAPESPAYNIVDLMHFPGMVDVAAMQQALEALVARHDSLRTSFTIHNGVPVQQVLPTVAITLAVHDVRQYPVAEQEAAWGRLAQAEGQKIFDLAQVPLFRCAAIQLPDAHLLVLTLQHIIADEWSMEVLQKELRSLYEGARRGQPAELSTLPIRYVDYARWQRTWLQGEVLTKQLEYWKGELAGVPALLELPTDRPRPVGQSFRGATEFRQMPLALLEQLKALGHAEQTTLFMTLLAGFMALLHKYAGQDDLTVGTPISGRTRSETEGLIGLFLNTVVVRATLTPETTFQALLHQVREKALGAYGHQDLPFEQLVTELAPERTASHSPLFQVMFILNNTDVVLQAAQISGLQQLGTRTSKFDLTFYVSESDQGLQLLMEYSTDLFDQATIQQMGTHFQQLLEVVARHPETKIAEASIMPETERDQLVRGWNDPSVEFPTHLTLHELFEAQAKKTPKAQAVTAEGLHLTYGELNRRANLLAHRLRTMGAGPDVLVGLFLERSLDMLVGILGILKTGAAYVPMDPEYPKERLGYILQDSHAPLVVTKQSLASQLPGFSGQLICLDVDWADIAKGREDDLVSGANPQTLAYVLFTSGSTGRPKGVAIEHHSAVTFVQWASRVFPPEELAGVLFSTSVCFDLSVFELFVTLNAGGTIIVAPNALHLPSLAEKHNVTLINTVPSAITELLHMGGVPASVKVVNLAGEALSDAVVEQIYARTNVQKVYNLYGPTEATTYSTYTLIPRGVPVTIGRPISNTQAYILDTHRKLVPRGVRGELYLAGEGLARGYYGRPDLTEERFVANPFESQPGARMYRTGDLCRWLPDKSIQYLGRLDHQVKLRGFRIELGEIEATLDRCAGVRQSLVLAREDQPGQKLLVAYVVPESGRQLEVEAMRLHLKQRLPEFMVPSSIIVLETFPLSPNGKINRVALPAPPEVQSDRAVEQVAPRNPIEQMLICLWSKVLKVKHIGVGDNFFELGGHSILAVRIIVEIEKLYGKRLPLATLIQAPTIEKLAQIIQQKQWTPLWSSLVPIRGGGGRPPLFLFHSHGGNVLEYYPLADLLDADQPVYALQARGLDGRIVSDQSMEGMVERYLKELRSLQPEGPYYLAGFCFGGLAALEAARQLSEAGETVALLGMIQTTYPHSDLFPGMSIIEQWWHQAKKMADLEWDNFQHRGTGHVKERIRRIVDVLGAKAAIAGDQFLGRNHGDYASRSMPYILERLAMEHERVYQAYRPRPYAGAVVLFRAQHQLPGPAQDRSLGWNDLLGAPLDVCDIPGHQQNVLLEPHIHVLANEFMSRLRQTQKFWADQPSRSLVV